MSEEPAKPNVAKIFSIKTKKIIPIINDVEAELVDGVEVSSKPSPVINPILIETLERALQEAKNGQITGCAMLLWYPEMGDFDRAVILPADDNPVHSIYTLMGVLNVLTNIDLQNYLMDILEEDEEL